MASSKFLQFFAFVFYFKFHFVVSRAIPTGVKSLTQADVNRKAVRLYRNCLRSTHLIMQLYGLDVSQQELRTAMRRQFETHRKLKNIAMADMLLWKGRLELEETIALFKTKAHVMQYLPQRPSDRLINHRDFAHLAPGRSPI